MSVPKAMLISQDLFDETIIENMQVFELSEDEALQETVEQFRTSGQSLHHLVLTLPNKEQEERAKRRNFLSTLQELDTMVQPDGTVGTNDEGGELRMKQIHDACSNDLDSTTYLTLLDAYDGIFTIMSFLTIIKEPDQINHSSTNLLMATLQALTTILTPKQLRFFRQGRG